MAPTFLPGYGLKSLPCFERLSTWLSYTVYSCPKQLTPVRAGFPAGLGEDRGQVVLRLLSTGKEHGNYYCISCVIPETKTLGPRP